MKKVFLLLVIFAYCYGQNNSQVDEKQVIKEEDKENQQNELNGKGSKKNISKRDYVKSNGYIEGINIVFKRVWRGVDAKAPSVMIFKPGNDSHAFLATSTGEIYFLKINSKGNVEKRIILNVSSFVDRFKKPSGIGYIGGLTGMTLDPNFLTNGYIYINFTSTSSTSQGILCRFRIDPLFPHKINFLERIEFIFDITYPNRNFVGGNLKFGPDGYLYIAIGSSSNYYYKEGKAIKEQNVAQDKKGLLGKILRVNINQPTTFLQYSSPKGNPFNNENSKDNDYRSEVYAYGFHEPKSMNFDKINSDLYVVDIGSGLMDEINIVEKGGNYGWSFKEGNASLGSDLESDKLKKPIYATKAKRFGGQRTEIIAGILYRGYALNGLFGYYIYADKKTREIFAIKYVDGKLKRKYYLGKTVKKLYALAVDNKGEIYGLADNDIFYFSDLAGDELAIVNLKEELEKDQEDE